MNHHTTLGLIQMSCSPDAGANVEKAIEHIRRAACEGAQIVCLQELFGTRYFCQSEDTACFDLAETIPGPTTVRLARLAGDLKIVIVASLFEKRTAGLYHNTAVLIDNRGEIAATYRKMHIPDDPFYYEKFYFTPGDCGFCSHATDFGNLGMLVCWDQWFPEAARLTALAGAQFLFYPTAIGWLNGQSPETNASQRAAWQTIQRSHAIANGVFVAVANRVGQEGELTFWGSSFVSDPFGRVLAEASQDQEEILLVECDLSRIEETRRNWPFLRDRRIDAYQGLNHRFLDTEK